MPQRWLSPISFSTSRSVSIWESGTTCYSTFFAATGLQADIRTLVSGGKPLVILLALATASIFLQNLTGIRLATAFGMETKAGLMVGSVSLTGAVGTALAWAPTFVESLGISNALELGVAANMVVLIAASVIGCPIARYLITRHKITSSGDTKLDSEKRSHSFGLSEEQAYGRED